MGPLTFPRAVSNRTTPPPMVGSDVGVASRDGVTLYVQGRIDEIEGKPLARQSPSELARFLLDKDVSQFTRARGQFSLIIDRNGVLRGLRSLYSPVSLYYSKDRLSSRLHDFRDEAPGLDFDYFARFLMTPEDLQSEGRLTPLQGVSRLAMGEWVELGAAGPNRVTYETIPENLVWKENQSSSEIAIEVDRRLLQIIDEAVRTHSGEIACELSGGLDSSYVNALVAACRKGHSAIMYSFSERASHQFSEDCADVIAGEFGIKLTKVPSSQLVTPDLTRPSPLRDEPNACFWQGDLFGPAVQANIADGSLLFTGFGCDQIFMRSPEVLPHYLRSRRLGAFVKSARGMGAELNRSPLNLMWQSAIALWPARPRFLSVEEVAPSANVTAMATWMREPFARTLRDQRLRFGKPDFSYLSAPWGVIGAYLDPKGIRHVHPYCDSRLIRFVREEVSAHLIHDFSAPYKHLLRQAQRGRVAERVRNRQANEFSFDGFYAKLLRKNAGFLRHLLSAPLPVGDDAVAKDKLAESFEQLLFGVMSPSTDTLARLIAYLMWWRDFKETN